MYKYAQLDVDGAVVGISDLSGEVDAPYMILLDGSRESDDKVGLGWRLTGGQWYEPVKEPPAKDQLLETPVTQAELWELGLLNLELTLGLLERLDTQSERGHVE